MSVLTREDVTGMILSAMRQAGLAWEGITEKIGMSVTWAGNPKGGRVKIGMSGKYFACNAW
ncbi:hypothetical protein [uncultured Roseibium sp.]|uniref:hypothetical protein n=1 Tax=uncultured Roseibium sp. TaxID=1936171 RepID=UPI002629BEB5|nr:hypothetical protein [uncultured Roseibium sp.]